MQIIYKTLTDLSDSIAMEMKLTLDAATEPWGVLVERVEVKDVRVPERLQKAMAAEAEAAREARAKVGPCHHYLENDDICIYISPCLR